MNEPAQLRRRVGRGGPLLPRPSRRAILVGGGIAGGLALAWTLWPRSATAVLNTNPGEHGFGAYLKIGTDGRVTVLMPQGEFGQGAFTAIAHACADELGADWRTIAVEPASISAAYANLLLLDEDAALATPRLLLPEVLETAGGWRRSVLAGSVPAMLTGGSTTLRMYEQPVRETAAIARALLCEAAARRWDADPAQCDTRDGFVFLGSRRARFGELADLAAQGTPPTTPMLRVPASGPLFGRDLPRLDLPAKIDGSMGFAADVRLPDMVFAAVRQGPVGDTRLKDYDRAAAARVTGFLSAVAHERWIAAVATNSWAAMRALDAMAPVFTSVGQRADSSVADARLKAAFDAPRGTRMVDVGVVADAMEGRPVLGADYAIAPALHQPLETRCAAAAPDGSRMRVWVATQAPGFCRAAVARALGVSDARIALFQMPGGGAFGIGYESDAAVQAALVASSVGRPVQLLWSRTEEILRDLPRPAARVRMRATLSSGATIDAWHAAIAAPPARHEWRERLGGARADQAMHEANGRADAAAVAGARPPYAIPNLAVDHLPVDVTLPAGRWPADAIGQTIFCTETFVDELARAAQADPFVFRIGMLGGAPRLAACLQAATALGGWEGGQSGSGQGIAVASLRGSHIAVMAVARPGERGLIVDRLVAAVDAGRVLNPGLVRQQIEAGLLFGLAAATGATARYGRGLARARRLADIGLPRLAQTPAIEIELMPSGAASGGYEEIGIPAVAPAIANALFTVTGQRIRRLPLSTKPLP